MATADLSVILPNHNHARYLPRCLEAIFTQSVQPREVIVIDDASTDNSRDVLANFAKRHPTLRILCNERNCGVVPTMNRGLQLVTSRFLASAAADDYILPGFYEKSLSLLERHPEAGLSFANDAFQFGEHGRMQPNYCGWPETPAFYDAEGICRYLRHTIAGHATIYRTDALRAAGGFDPDLAWYCDWFVNLTLAFRHGACHIPEPLAVRVLLEDNFSAHANRSGVNHIAVLKTFFDRITAPALADVAPWFQKNGALTYFGTDVLRAAATRPDVWQPRILGFLNGFTREQYREVLSDADSVVRELAAFFLGPFWHRDVEREQEAAAVLESLRTELQAAKRRIPPSGAAAKLKWLGDLTVKRLLCVG
jgi:glycosyltransferase involved in cell wall biosynthesis